MTPRHEIIKTSVVLLVTAALAFFAGVVFERQIGIDMFLLPSVAERVETGQGGHPNVIQPRAAVVDSLPLPADSIIVLGDSLIDLQEWSELFPGTRVLNRGIGGARISDITGRFDMSRARAVFCLIGINDIGHGVSFRQFASDYDRFVRSLPSRVPFYALSLPPVLRYGSRSIDPPLIRRCNTFIRNEVRKRGYGAYIDIYYPLLKGMGPRGRATFFVNDGIHLNAEGYAVVTSIVRPYLDHATKEPLSRETSHHGSPGGGNIP